jgi:hypothetical protein
MGGFLKGRKKLEKRKGRGGGSEAEGFKVATISK